MYQLNEDIIRARLGYVADPGIEMLLDKHLVARIKVVQLETQIKLLEMQLEASKIALDALREQYKVG